MLNDFDRYRNDFPVLQKKMNGQPVAFLDSAASAQKPQMVIDAMRAVMETDYANIHRGLYQFSQVTTAKFEAVRKKIADFIGAGSEKRSSSPAMPQKGSILSRKAGAGLSWPRAMK